MSDIPVIGISACRKNGDMEYHNVYHKYVQVVLRLGALPFLIPSVGDMIDLSPLLNRLDGLLLTGSPSNVQPRLYDCELNDPTAPADHSRDATTLPLIRAAVNTGVPVFGICRGLQEINVALGGTLDQDIHQNGRSLHFLDHSHPISVRYAPRHEVEVKAGTWLADWVKKPRLLVNSVHTQAINQIAPGLTVEATADDGTVEAIRQTGGAGFLYGTQWHPEHDYDSNDMSQVILGEFQKAVRTYAQAH